MALRAFMPTSGCGHMRVNRLLSSNNNINTMAPRSKSKRQKRQRKQNHKGDISVLKLVTRGKVSGQLSQRSFEGLSPLVRVPLEAIGEGLLDAGHVFLGFVQSGRYILSYTQEEPEWELGEEDPDPEEPPSGGYNLYWWEFNLRSKLKLAQQVRLFRDGEADEIDDLNLHVCEWPNDDSSIAIFGFDASIAGTDQLMMNLQSTDHVPGWFVWYVTIAPNPPSTPCSHCSAMATCTGIAGSKCLEHGYVLHGEAEVNSPFPFQPALQLKKDKVILLKENRMLVACAFYLCPAGEQSQSCQMLFTKRADQPSSPSTLPQHCQQGTSSERQVSLSEERNQCKDKRIHGYTDYRRLHYYIPQPETAQGSSAEDDFLPYLTVTDLKGREERLRRGGPNDRQSLCVETMYLDVGRLLQVLPCANDLWQARDGTAFDFVLLDVCPQTDSVLIAIGLFWKCEICDMTVSWDLGTGLCHVLGVKHLTTDVPYKGQFSGNHSAVKSFRKSHVDTMMEHSVPESSSHRVNVIDGLPKRVLADPERCTWVTTR